MIRTPALVLRTAIVGLVLISALFTGALAATSSFAATATASTGAPAVAPANVRACSSATVNWVALYPSFADWVVGRDATHCIGDKGTWDVPSNDTDVFCAGNNKGTVTFYDRLTKTTHTESFSDDRSYSMFDGVWQGASGLADSLDIMTVTITGWTGSAGC
jgi:hypothetical protein